MNKERKMTTENLILCGVFTALIAVGAFIRVPVPFVPFTLQVLFVFLAGILLGPRLGALSAALYMVLGLIGVPVFTQGGGPGYVLQPTFGYIIGFAVGAYIIGYLAKKVKEQSVIKLVLINMIGLLIIYGFGVVYFYCLNNFVLGAVTSMWTVFLYGAIMCAPGDLLLCVLAAVLGKRLKKAIR